MDICIVRNADELYLQECYDKKIQYSRLRHLLMAQICGKWIKVHTEYLFRDQFNTDYGRIHAHLVSDVRFDERIGLFICEKDPLRISKSYHSFLPDEQEFIYQFRRGNVPAIPDLYFIKRDIDSIADAELYQCCH